MKYQKKNGRSEQRVIAETSDRYRYIPAGSYTPARLTQIFRAANQGDIEQLALCCREITERNWDIIGALEQRAAGVCGTPWEVKPGGTNEIDLQAAAEFKQALENTGEANGISRTNNFYELIRSMMDAVVYPFAASEIVWTPGGGISGFSEIETHHFTLRDSFEPRLITDEFPNGMPLPENQFVIHSFRRKADPARAGLIRVLAWLHCLQNWPLKDLFSFIERFGMPFVVAKVSPQAWDTERDVLKAMIANFGPNGGGVFTNSTDIQLMNAANTGSDNVYFHALEFCHDAIYTLLVGQLASSGESSGLSGGDAQSKVRQDILESDARSIEATVRSQIAAPWTRFHYGEAAAVPRLHFKVEPPEDVTATATLVQTLYNAGLEADPEEMSRKFGFKLTRREQTPNAFAMSAEKKEMPDVAGAVNEWLGPLADELDALTDENVSENEFAERLAVCAEGKKFGSSEKFETLDAENMKDQYDGSFNQGQRR